MIRTLFFVAAIVFGVITTAMAEVKNFTPVTQEMLLNPSPDDWLMLSRTYDQQRFSPLKQINRRNVAQLRMAWARGMGVGITESVPIVYQGVMYVVAPEPSSIGSKKDGERHVTCFQNTRSYWPLAYHPGKNSLYIPYMDACVDMTVNGARSTIARPGSAPKALAGIAKVNMATGHIDWRYTQRAPGNGAMLATAGDLIFWGDLDRRFRAFDADTGKILWETTVGGIISVSTITYAVKEKQYVAVMTGDGQSGTAGPLRVATELKPPRSHNAIYVFALP